MSTTTESVPSTAPLFLEDTYLLEAEGTVRSVESEGDGRIAVTTDQTILFPQGGGQPSDTGEIISEHGHLRVEHVSWERTAIRHRGPMVDGQLRAGDRVRLKVDAERRLLNARIHSAGELICAAIRDLGHLEWHVAGAIHYPDRASVEYQIMLPADAREKLRCQVQARLNQLVETGGSVNVTTVPSRAMAEQLCGFFPDYLPEGEPLRIVTVYGNVGRPCQGTHVKDIAEIGDILITKVKSRKGRTKISYRLA